MNKVKVHENSREGGKRGEGEKKKEKQDEKEEAE